MIQLALHGANGRMGQRVSALAADDARFDSVSVIPRPETVSRGRIGELSCDVIIDFSSPSGTSDVTRIAVETSSALVVGTTGLTRENRRQLADAAGFVPILIAPNMAIGVVVLHHLVAEATRLLGSRFMLSLSETHHTAKRDAPSGTALRLAEVIRATGGPTIPSAAIRSIREGDVIGDHKINFESIDENLEISHSARSRDVFARGALEAASWLSGRSPGQYTIEAAFGLVPA